VAANKRRHPRVRTKDVASHYRVGEVTALGMPVENISMGGLFVSSNQPMPVGTLLVLELTRPGMARAIKLTGRVVVSIRLGHPRELAPGMGVQFDALAPDTERRLRALIDALGPEAEPVSVPEYHPARVDASTGDVRAASFDFGLVSLDQLPGALPSAPRKSPPRPKVSPRRPPSKPAELPPVPPPLPPSPAIAPPVTVPDGAKLQVQIRGLLMELGDTQAHADEQERQLSELRAENQRLRDELAKRDERIAALEGLLRR
jgi:hypothetical protein